VWAGFHAPASEPAEIIRMLKGAIAREIHGLLTGNGAEPNTPTSDLHVRPRNIGGGHRLPPTDLYEHIDHRHWSGSSTPIHQAG
jgi:hypothetical protein